MLLENGHIEKGLGTSGKNRWSRTKLKLAQKLANGCVAAIALPLRRTEVGLLARPSRALPLTHFA
jgi:hypothetical protein